MNREARAELYPWLSGHWSFFMQRLEADKLAHALLIVGPSGVGKTALACTMVARLLCTEDHPLAEWKTTPLPGWLLAERHGVEGQESIDQ